MTALLALGSSLLWGTADFLGGTTSRRLPAYAVLLGSQGTALAVLVPLAVLTGAVRAPLGYLPWAIAAGLVGLVALAAFYTALATGTMGVVAPIAATSAVVPVAVGLARGDAPAPVAVVGIVAACIGVVLASGPERGGARGAALRPVGLALVAALGFGLVLVLLAGGAQASTLMTLTTMRAVTVAVLVVAAVVRRSGRGFAAADLPVLATVGICDASANAAYAAATTRGALSVVAVLGSLYPAVTVLLARQVHGERLRPVQSIGVAVALAGVVLIGAGGTG